MSMVDPVAISVETTRIDSWCSLEKEFTELMSLAQMNDYMYTVTNDGEVP